MEDQFVISRLKDVAFFKNIAGDDLIIKKIASLCKKRSFPTGRQIIKEGDSGDELFIILSGEVDIVKNTLQNEEYTVATLSAEKDCVAVGEQGLIDNDRRSATVVAKTPCSAVVIHRDDFIKFGNDNPGAGLSITREIAKRISANLRKSNADVITLFSALVHEIDER